MNPNFEKIKSIRVKNGKISRPHTKETKNKISEGRKKYLQDSL